MYIYTNHQLCVVSVEIEREAVKERHETIDAERTSQLPHTIIIRLSGCFGDLIKIIAIGF